MLSLLLEKEPSEEEVEEDEAEEVEEEEQPPDEQTVLLTEEISSCFELFDKTKSGSFEIKHLEKALRCLGIFLTSFQLEELREALDSDGFVKYEPFYEYTMEKLIEMDPIDDLKNAFQAFDPENEGVLPNDRVKRWLTTLGDPLTEKEAKDLIKLGDPSGKGVISYNELVMVLLSG